MIDQIPSVFNSKNLRVLAQNQKFGVFEEKRQTSWSISLIPFSIFAWCFSLDLLKNWSWLGPAKYQRCVSACFRQFSNFAFVLGCCRDWATKVYRHEKIFSFFSKSMPQIAILSKFALRFSEFPQPEPLVGPEKDHQGLMIVQKSDYCHLLPK